MNRINSIRSLTLAIALAAFGGSFGCAGQATDEGSVQGTEPSRRAHMVNANGGSNDDGSLLGDGVNVEHTLDTSHSPLHPQAGANLGPRPEPWMHDNGDTGGPRPEPWHRTNPDDAPPDEATPVTGSSSSSGGGGSGGTSSGGNPGNPSNK